ncbi:hypothetical protein [Arthrobacter sp. AET 35A]|uniref:hypothetical protein n=1 Tax=Arthrobacter sp. AET 35A TaxID=2292643 RepID=UPI00177C6DFE|nr:hypothetical protein [Arthrobacter sp. AET 35A]
MAWDPQTIEEWAMYAVRERLIEELLTGAWLKAVRHSDGRVTWLEADLGPGT